MMVLPKVSGAMDAFEHLPLMWAIVQRRGRESRQIRRCGAATMDADLLE
jgi:hypothetical protein